MFALLGLLSFAVLTTTSLAQTITVGTVSGLPGETVQVPVDIDSAAGAGVNFSLTYDGGKLTNFSATKGSLATANHIADSHSPVAGTGNAIVYPNPVVDFAAGGGSLAIVSLQISDTANGGESYPLTVADLTLADNQGAVIPTTNVNGAVNVGGPSFPTMDDFEGNEDGWTYAGILPAGVGPTSGFTGSALTMLAFTGQNDFPQFGFWQSPQQQVVKSSLYKFSFTLRTDDANIADEANIPTHRVRVNFLNTGGTPMAVATNNDSKAGGSYLLANTNKVFNVYVQPQSEAANLIGAFDLNYFNVFDHKATIILEQFEVDRVGLSTLTGQTTLKTWTFATDEEGWVFNDFNSTSFPSTLAYNAADQALDMTATQFPSFGIWQSPAVPELICNTNKLYRFAFTVSTTEADQSLVPSVRFRWLTSNNEYIQTTVFNSNGDNVTHMPTTAPKTYYNYFIPSSDGQQILLAVDLTAFDPTDNTNTATIKIHDVTAESWDIPTF
ncbi:MAG: hypothetical protein Kow0059_21820 [Candidatus Sumerlaeia bacterium]